MDQDPYHQRMQVHRDVFESARRLRDQLLRDGADVARNWGSSAADFSARLGACSPEFSYQYHPELCRKLGERIYTELGPAATEAFYRLVATYEILALEARATRWNLPDPVWRNIESTVRALLGQIESGRMGYFSTANEFFVKDLAVCRMKLLPCGAELVDPFGGFARSMLWKASLRDGWNFGRALLRMGGNHPTLVAHWDRRAIGDFNAPGYRRFYLTVAAIMELHPRIRGLCGESWWFDPEVSRISPELAFLSEESRAAGAICIPVHTDEKTTLRALYMSGARRAAYERGEYVPRAMFWLWPRSALLKWAASVGPGPAASR